MRSAVRIRNYFRNNLFMRIILLFSVITIVTIIAFSYLMLHSMSGTAINRELDNQKKVMDSVNDHITNKYNSVHAMVEGIYRDSYLSAGLTYFLEHSYQEYIQHNLENYELNSNRSGAEVLQYFKNIMEDDSDIKNLILYSADQQVIYAYNQNKQIKLYDTDSVHTYIPDTMSFEGNNIALPNQWIRRMVQQWDTHLYSVRTQINDTQSFTNIGQLIVYFDSDGVMKSISDKRNKSLGRILVLTNEGGVVFDSLGKMYGKTYPNMKIINSFYESSVQFEHSYVTKLTQSKGGFIVLGIISDEEMAQSYRGLRNTILTISAICIFVAIVIPSLFVVRFARRTKEIIAFTHKVKNGDLNARIASPREDELGQISHSFNNMLDELNLYIDQVYKAEIKQKESELTALQARINPHFLYNTLEVIRMRAISQGTQDVGEMIYSLSALFRSQVQQKAVYLLQDELEACRLYLELFRIRYKDKFSYVIKCDAELGRKRTLRMSLQPIIENYIVHGLRNDRTDNQITIIVSRVEKRLLVQITDNGNGIAEDRLEIIKKNLSPDAAEGESFGLRSVNERLKLLYGSEYGVDIESDGEAGTIVNIGLPDMEEKEGV